MSTRYFSIDNKATKVFLALIVTVISNIHSLNAVASTSSTDAAIPKCSNGLGLKYLSGDALTDPAGCLGPNNIQYPTGAISRLYSNWSGNSRRARESKFSNVLNPAVTSSALLKAYSQANKDILNVEDRHGRSSLNSREDQCRASPARLCQSRYNTTAPMYGVSLTTGQPVTIVQKFPDLLQQVVFETCLSSECALLRGECTQTYVPYLFLVIPLGPVTLTGADYVLVESSCVCKPTL